MLKSILTYFCLGVIFLIGITSTFAQTDEPVTKMVTNPDLGTILAASNDLTLYTFANDKDGISSCEGDCAGSWPPYLVTSDTPLVAQDGIPGVLGTTTRSDGSLQLTYDGNPVYFFITDDEPGEANGEGAGGVWYAVRLEVSLAVDDDTAATSPANNNGEGVSIGKADDANLGSILVDENGMTLYTFANDEAGISNCVSNCAELWPPLLADEGAPIQSENIAGEFNTIERNDGTFQVAFNGRPVYFYSEDTQPGDVNGHGVGDVWFAIALDTLRVKNHPELGSILIANNGMTLYTFANDEAGISNCVSNCAELWPPFTAPSSDESLGVGAGVTGELNTLTREDGRFQVTLNGRPLYFYSEDAVPGDVNGHGVGDVWFAVSFDTVRIGNTPELGNILVASNGHALYTFAKDEPGWSNCVGDCSSTWTPLTVKEAGALFAAGSLQDSLETSERADGTLQVTLNNQPLYFFAGDTEAGTANGHGVGDVWFAFQLDVALQISGNEALGGFLAGRDGMTVYTFANDESGVSNCVDNCATTWPPLTITGFPISTDSLPGALGTITRADGSIQITLDGRPLYNFSNDVAPGDANGQGAGDVWYIVPIEADASQFASASCIVTVTDFENVNVRQLPSTATTITREIPRGESALGAGQTTADDGYVWYQLQASDWVRSDVVTASDTCASLPEVTP